MKEEHFEVYSVGIQYASICTNLSTREATRRINAEIPIAIRLRWRASKNPTFHSGQPNPCPCEQNPKNRHILFEC